MFPFLRRAVDVDIKISVAHSGVEGEVHPVELGAVDEHDIGVRSAHPVVAMAPHKRNKILETPGAIGGLQPLKIAHGAQSGGVVLGPLLQFF